MRSAGLRLALLAYIRTNDQKSCLDQPTRTATVRTADRALA